MKLIKESNNEQKAEALKANDRSIVKSSIVKSIRNTMIIGLPLTTVMSGVLAVGFAIALDGCSSKEKTAGTDFIFLQPEHAADGGIGAANAGGQPNTGSCGEEESR